MAAEKPCCVLLYRLSSTVHLRCSMSISSIVRVDPCEDQSFRSDIRAIAADLGLTCHKGSPTQAWLHAFCRHRAAWMHLEAALAFLSTLRPCEVAGPLTALEDDGVECPLRVLYARADAGSHGGLHAHTWSHPSPHQASAAPSLRIGDTPVVQWQETHQRRRFPWRIFPDDMFDAIESYDDGDARAHKGSVDLRPLCERWAQAFLLGGMNMPRDPAVGFD